MFLLNSSTYIQLGLAEEFKKPIINVRVEDVSEIDPGLKLIIQRRQVCHYDHTLCCIEVYVHARTLQM